MGSRSVLHLPAAKLSTTLTTAGGNPMAIPAATSTVDERDLYPLHEEDDAMGENPDHYDQARYLVGAVRVRHPSWFVTSNLCVYWEPGNYQRYRAPDLLAVRAAMAPARPRVYLVWRDPPVNFVAEVGSRSSQREDEGPKVDVYQDQVRAREYLYADPPRGVLRLWRMGGDGTYAEVPPEVNGRIRSAELDLEFGIDEAQFLRIYTAEGEMFLTHEEEAARRDQAEARAAEEARARQVAEARASEEAHRRAELERQIAELRARLGETGE
jgi:Uma2 family endonuclease